MSSEDYPAVYHGPARNEYPRADGKVVHLGKEVEAPSSEYPLWRRTYVHSAVSSCPECGAMAHFRDIPVHNAWHRELKQVVEVVNRLTQGLV